MLINHSLGNVGIVCSIVATNEIELGFFKVREAKKAYETKSISKWC